MNSSNSISAVDGSSEKHIIMHIDLDAFFASCEEVRDPSLIGRPVVIGADPKKGKGRGIVSTANYAARKYGIHSAMPISWAYKRCPNAVFLRGDFRLYRDVSNRFFMYITSLGFPFEKTSVDEGYLDLSGKTNFFAKKLARNIMKWLLQHEKITCSIGIGPNKRIAKIASEHNKPEGMTVVTEEKVQAFLAGLRVEKIPGIGPVMKRKLNRHHYIDVGDIQKKRETELIEEFGKTRGAWLYNIARGAGSTTVGRIREQKSVSKEYTFMINEANHTIVLERLHKLTKKIWDKTKKNNTEFRTITIKIRYGDFETHTHQKTNKKTFDSLTETENTAKTLFEKHVQDRAVRLIGIRFNGFITE